MRHSVRLVLQQVLGDDFEVFQNRDLIGIDLDYLFLDGSHFKMHDGTNAEPVMVAYAITTVGQPVLVVVEPTAAESTDAWADFLAGLTRRGRPQYVLVPPTRAGRGWSLLVPEVFEYRGVACRVVGLFVKCGVDDG